MLLSRTLKLNKPVLVRCALLLAAPEPWADRISAVLQADDELTLLDHKHDRAREMIRDGFTLEDKGDTTTRSYTCNR